MTTNVAVTGNLRTFAEATVGEFVYLSDIESIHHIFDNIEIDIDFTSDKDKDGIPDYYEEKIIDGVLRLGDGTTIDGLQMGNPDTDGDGLLDGDELVISVIDSSAIKDNEQIVYVRMHSNPTMMDTDGDKIDDGIDPERMVYNRYGDLGSELYIDDLLNVVNDKFNSLKEHWSIEFILSETNNFAIKSMQEDLENYKEYRGNPNNVSNENWTRYCLKFNSYATKSGFIYKELHYFRNELNRVPDTLDDLIKDKDNWYLMPISESLYHMYDTPSENDGMYNLKFVSIAGDGIYEAVYDKDGKLLDEIIDSVNMGTYNFAPSGELSNDIRHTLFDVIPYYQWGNVENSNVLLGLFPPIINQTDENLLEYREYVEAQFN